MSKREVYAASEWNDGAADVRGAWPLPGVGVRLEYRGEHGVTITAERRQEFSHPWRVRARFEFLPPGEQTAERRGEWRAYLEPGFVNGRDAFIDMPEGWPDTASGETKRQVPLTDDPAPYLALTNWRNPLLPAGVNTAAALSSGEVSFLPGEGYPAFFEKLGVRPPAKGGGFTGLEPENPPGRDRELRAIDIVLTKPRLGSSLGATALDPLTSGHTHQLDTTYQNGFYRAKKGRAYLTTAAKFRPLDGSFLDSPFLSLPMNAGDPQFDQIKLSTVYVVSPPGAGSEATPDETWQPFAKHDVFWNLAHGNRYSPPATPEPGLRISTGLGAGLLDFLANAMLAPINSGLGEVRAFLQQSDMRGMFWTV